MKDADIPHPNLVKPPETSTTKDGDPDAWKTIAAGLPPFQISYDEGLKVGYKWYDAEKKPVLFPFGFGLSYTTYAYSDLKVDTGSTDARDLYGEEHRGRDGAEVAQVYASLPASAGEPPKRLVAFSKINLAAGESKAVSVEVPAAVSLHFR